MESLLVAFGAICAFVLAVGFFPAAKQHKEFRFVSIWGGGAVLFFIASGIVRWISDR